MSLAALLFTGPAPAADAPLAVDYAKFEPTTWSAPDISCKRAKLGLRCRSEAESRRSIWSVSGPSAGTITGSYNVDLILGMKWGGAAGVAFGMKDGTWSGVLVRQDTRVWAGGYDGKDWVTGIDWYSLVRSGPGGHNLHVEVVGQQITVTVDGRALGTYTSALPLSGEVAPLVYGNADVTFVTLTAFPRL